MPTIADLKAKIEVSGAAQAKKDLADIKGKAGSGGSGILGLADGFKTGLGAVTGFITGFTGFKIAEDALGAVKDQLVDVLQAGMDQQKVMAQTAAVIKSTGGAAHISADQVGELADHLAQLTGISNNNIQSATNLLLTFTDIKANILPQTTALVLDMATAMHEDLQSAAIQVGKALQDPIQGATALRRVGVQLSQQQTDLVKHFVETGQKAKAQQIILGELTREMGGSAEAAGKTLPGQLARLNVSFDQAKEKIGLAVIPILQKLLDSYIMPLADWLGKLLPAAIQVTTDFLNKQLIPAVAAVMNSPFVKTIEGWAQSIAQKLDPELNTHLPGAATKSKTAIDTVKTSLKTQADEAGGHYATQMQKAIDKIDGATTSLGGTTPAGKGLNPAVMRVNDNLDKMDAKLNANAAAQAHAQQQTKFLGGVFDGLGNAVGGAVNWFKQFGDEIGPKLGPALDTVHRILDGLRERFSGTLDGLRNMWDGFWNILTFPVRFAAEGVRTEVNILLDGLRGDWKQEDQDIKDGWNRIGGTLRGFGEGIVNFLKGLGETWLGLISTPFKQMWATVKPSLDQFGKSFSQWWSNLIPNAEQAIYNFTHMIQDYINSHMPHFPGINIPGFGGNTPGRASGGPISGVFKGAELGAELLVTPGTYYAPPGSYVYNAQQTQQILGGGGMRGGGGTTYQVTVYGADYNSARAIANDVTRQLNRKAALYG